MDQGLSLELRDVVFCASSATASFCTWAGPGAHHFLSSVLRFSGKNLLEWLPALLLWSSSCRDWETCGSYISAPHTLPLSHGDSPELRGILCSIFQHQLIVRAEAMEHREQSCIVFRLTSYLWTCFLRKDGEVSPALFWLCLLFLWFSSFFPSP